MKLFILALILIAVFFLMKGSPKKSSSSEYPVFTDNQADYLNQPPKYDEFPKSSCGCKSI